MKLYSEMSASELQEELKKVTDLYNDFSKKGLSLDMSRGKPSAQQLNLSMPMLDVLSSSDVLKAEDGMDTRNYGGFDGISEAKSLLAEILETSPKNIFVGGNSSLNLMYDTIARSMNFGVCGSAPWCKQDKVKFLCPVPGYDRHFAICELFGIEMINIPMDQNGPDMKMVKALVESDDSIKGIWCVPKYSNPSGITYSNDTVRAFASLSPKADDFRIFWDNAYCVHHINDNHDELLNILTECENAGNPDMIYEFISTSKITFSGGGIAAIATSQKNLAFIKKVVTIQTIGFDKINQLRHARYFKNASGVVAHMEKHRELIAPKFEAVATALDAEITSRGIGSFTKPNGGYFISFDSISGCATRIYELCKNAGVILTPAGAPFPYGKDPDDKNIRISPTFPPVSELNDAMELFCISVRMASLEKLM